MLLVKQHKGHLVV